MHTLSDLIVPDIKQSLSITHPYYSDQTADVTIEVGMIQNTDGSPVHQLKLVGFAVLDGIAAGFDVEFAYCRVKTRDDLSRLIRQRLMINVLDKDNDQRLYQKDNAEAMAIIDKIQKILLEPAFSYISKQRRMIDQMAPTLDYIEIADNQPRVYVQIIDRVEHSYPHSNQHFNVNATRYRQMTNNKEILSVTGTLAEYDYQLITYVSESDINDDAALKHLIDHNLIIELGYNDDGERIDITHSVRQMIRHLDENINTSVFKLYKKRAD